MHFKVTERAANVSLFLYKKIMRRLTKITLKHHLELVFLFTVLQHLVCSMMGRNAFIIGTYLEKRTGTDWVD